MASSRGTSLLHDRFIGVREVHNRNGLGRIGGGGIAANTPHAVRDAKSMVFEHLSGAAVTLRCRLQLRLQLGHCHARTIRLRENCAAFGGRPCASDAALYLVEKKEKRSRAAWARLLVDCSVVVCKL